MYSTIKIFDQYTIRATKINNIAYFSAIDICNIIGCSSYKSALKHVDNYNKCEIDISGSESRSFSNNPTKDNHMVLLNKDGVYDLSMYASYEMNNIREFQNWIDSQSPIIENDFSLNLLSQVNEFRDLRSVYCGSTLYFALCDICKLLNIDDLNEPIWLLMDNNYKISSSINNNIIQEERESISRFINLEEILTICFNITTPMTTKIRSYIANDVVPKFGRLIKILGI